MNKHLISFLIICFAPVFAQNIQTIAGGGPHNIPALQIGVPLPSGLVVDSAGNVYVSASGAGQIWKIDSLGRVNVFAGTGASLPANSDLGDGLQAVNALLSDPKGLAFDTAGNLYVADSNNHRVRKISPSGVISTVAGTGGFGYSGDGGLATAAQFYFPMALATDAANNLYISDVGHTTFFPYAITGQTIRKVSPSGMISTVAGNGSGVVSGDGGPAISAGFSNPQGIAVDSNGVLYIVDSDRCRVRKVVGGIISAVAGNGACEDTGDGAPAVSAHLAFPTAVAVDRFDNVYIVEQSAVRMIAAGQPNITTFASGVSNEHSIAIDGASGNVYLGSFTGIINKVAGGLTSIFLADIPGSLPAPQNASDVKLYNPSSLAADNAGSLYFSDPNSFRIRKLTLSAGLISTAAGTGVFGTSPDGAPVSGPIGNVFGIAFDAFGNYSFKGTGFVDGDHIRKVSGGIFSTLGVLPTINGGTSASVVAANGDIYFANQGEQQIHLLTKQTGVTSLFAGTGTGGAPGDGGLALNASLGYISSLALDGAGNLFLADSGSVRKIAISSTIINTVAGGLSSGFADGVIATATGISPASLFVDQSNNLFFVDGNRVRKVTAATKLISTVAGNGMGGFTGDGGPATLAGITPVSITVDRAQNLYIGDGSGRIRSTKVSACFLTISTPVVYVGRLGGTGSVTVTATNPDCPYSVSSSLPFVTITGSSSGTGSGTVTFSVATAGNSNRASSVSVGGTSFNISQAGTIGQQNVGYFQPSGGPLWILDSNGSGVYEGSDKTFGFAGPPGAIAVVGDWNGDGRSKVGYYLNGFWALDFNGNGAFDAGDKFYAFGGGDASYVPVVGDWNGDGRTKIGFYRNGFWALDINGDGIFNSGDGFYGYGGKGVGEVPVVGDWNGDGRTKVGIYYQGVWILDTNGDGTFNAGDKYYTTFSYAAGDKPVVGDWNYDGKTKIGVYRAGFWVLDFNGNGTYDGVGAGGDKFYGFGGNAGEVPLVGDWNGDGRSKIGFYLNGFWALDNNGNGSFDGTGPGGDRFLAYGGTAGNQPLIGRW